MEKILRHGVPEYGLHSPSWPDSQPGAPAGHWCLQQGARIYRGDRPATVEGCTVILHHDDTATRRSEHDSRYWLVPVDVHLFGVRALTDDETDLLTRFLAQFFSEGFEVEGVRHHARHYLSTSTVHVFSVRDVDARPYKTTEEGWRTEIASTFTFLCAGREPQPGEPV